MAETQQIQDLQAKLKAWNEALQNHDGANTSLTGQEQMVGDQTCVGGKET